MSFRWPRYLPRFPAVLLMPTVFVTLAGLGVNYSSGYQSLQWDFPMKFGLANFEWVYGWSIVGVVGFLVDVSFALAVAWAFAMAVDRLVFPFIPRRRRREPATPPEPS